jgi:Na+/proline symporter/nitrogen-specific signal transduction histidine kinase
MLGTTTVVAVSFLYLGLLFAIAWYGDRRATEGRSIIASPMVYSLSLAVYCTAWTFYGSVGLAVDQGVAFLPTYLGPTLMAALWPLVLVKMLRIAKAQRITSIADFIASRYGKSSALAALVSIIAVVGVVPYIALQLKAVSISFTLVAADWPALTGGAGVLTDSALYIALFMAAFTIIFGTRQIDATERHEGLVAAVAFESLVKLVAFLLLGIFVTFVLFSGPQEIFSRAAEHPELRELLRFENSVGSYGSWFTLTLLAMFAILLLPRQFQVAVVENVDERHVRRAVWMLPLYLFIINLFVLPVAIGGALYFDGREVSADSFVLALPLAEGRPWLAMLVYVGGVSAATSMIIVETTALATMVSNDLVMPALLKSRRFRVGVGDISRQLLIIRRAAIVAVVLLGYLYFRLAGEARTLVSIGLISFAAVAQFAPALFGGLFWKEATRVGAISGLMLGFLIWAYTLLLPSFIGAGGLVADGPFGIEWLRPTALFGLDALDQLSHGVFWSLFFNLGAFITVSLIWRPGAAESAQAALFVDAMSRSQRQATVPLWRGGAPIRELRVLLERIVGAERADQVLRQQGPEATHADPALMQQVESALAGSIGSASARIMVESISREAPLSLDEVLGILDETQQAIHYSRQLEEKSRALAHTTEELQRANQRLRELDRLKDEFMSTVTHELRTPLTSIRAFSEILNDNPELPVSERSRFLGIVIKETERLTRLINQVLDLARLESQRMDWEEESFSVREVIGSALDSTAQLFRESGVTVVRELDEASLFVRADRDRLTQVMLNLLSNALKFAPARNGRVEVRCRREGEKVHVEVSDNGPGIAAEEQEIVFEKFRQSGDALTGKPRGTGLGLPISRQIIEHFGGTLTVRSRPGEGATFIFTLPLEAPHG